MTDDLNCAVESDQLVAVLYGVLVDEERGDFGERPSRQRVAEALAHEASKLHAAEAARLRAALQEILDMPCPFGRLGDSLGDAQRIASAALVAREALNGGEA